ncbi:MAG: hypothetical protein H6515_13045 [Microthrixaceae bacterium]|nr:hypothetical protein [Microthrixaceae bacterium]
MGLAADHSNLPRTSPNVDGWTPDPEPRYIGVLADTWAANNDDNKPTALGTRLRHSDAGKCSRYLGYTAAAIPKSDPMDLAGVWNVTLGTLLHEAWQAALEARHPDAQIEATFGWDDLDASCHIDALIVNNHKRISYELKTIGGYGFKAAVGKARRGTPAEGPKPEHVTQAALNGLAADADQIVVGYLAKETISTTVGEGMTDLARFAAEWTLDRDEFEPIANAEKARMAAILALVDEGSLPARKFPAGTLPPGAEIVDPATGRWEARDESGQVADTGSWWACAYCSHRTLCTGTEAGRIDLASVTGVEVAS